MNPIFWVHQSSAILLLFDFFCMLTLFPILIPEMLIPILWLIKMANKIRYVNSLNTFIIAEKKAIYIF